MVEPTTVLATLLSVRQTTQRSNSVGETKDNALTNALQWLCSPRGGNNFYGRVLNGCRRVSAPEMGTANVTLDRNTGKYLLVYDLEWFESLNVHEQLFIIQHEACHIILQHLPRAIWMYNNLASGSDLQLNHRLGNVAMDFAVNSSFLKKEMDAMGDACRFLNPKDYEFPDKLMYEEYLAELIQKAEKVPMFSLSLSSGNSNNPSQKEESDNDEGSGDTSPENNNEENDDTETGSGGGSDEENKEEKEDNTEGEGNGEGEESDTEEGDTGSGDNSDDTNGEEDHPEFPKHLFDPKKELKFRTEAETERLVSELGKEIKEMVKNAYDQTVRRRGTIPAEIKSYVEELLKEPEVPWEQIFRNMLRSSIIAKMDESAVIPNYSLLPVMGQGILPYPGLQCDTAINISIVIDTSGSINDKDFIKFVTELGGIVNCSLGIRLHIVMFDAVIQYEEFLSDIEVEEMRAVLKTNKTNTHTRYGRGGTDFNPPFQCVKGVSRDEIPRAEACGGNWEEHSFQKPDLVVFLTDGCAPVSEDDSGPIPAYQPDCPVIWVICGGTSAQVHPAMGQRVVVLSE